MEFKSSDAATWKKSLSSYETLIRTNPKPKLIPLDDFYRNELPILLQSRNPNPYMTTEELSKVMEWKLTRGKWRPRLLSFVSSLSDDVVRAASQKAFLSLPDDVAKAVQELTVLKGVGPATASAVLAAYAPNITPFMSDEAMDAAIGDSKDYSLKRYLLFLDKIQAKAKEVSTEEEIFTPSDIERALWCSAVDSKLKGSSTKPEEGSLDSKSKGKRKR